MKTYRFNIRRWLNREGFHASAHIISRVEDTSARHGGGHREGCKLETCTCFNWGEVSLIIADCTRSISLDFDDIFSDDHDERSNAFYKIDSLIEDLTNFRAALAAEAKHQAAVRRAKRDAGAKETVAS